MSGQRVGIVGDRRLEAAVESAGLIPIDGDASNLDSAEFVLLDGETSVVEFARSAPDVPAFVVGDVDGIPSVPRERTETALESALEGSPVVERHPIVAASGAFGSISAVFDIALMAAEPARISEFSVSKDGTEIARFRADGVVASTPAGSHGYNRAAGGPVVSAGTGVASVVPIAPFSTSAGHWIAPIDSVELAVERDETPVELLVDGRRERRIDADDTVELSVTDTIETYTFPDPE